MEKVKIEPQVPEPTYLDINPGDLLDKSTPTDSEDVGESIGSLTPKSAAHNAASRHVATATQKREGVNKPVLFNAAGVPKTVKSVVESNRTGLFRINRDKGINN